MREVFNKHKKEIIEATLGEYKEDYLECEWNEFVDDMIGYSLYLKRMFGTLDWNYIFTVLVKDWFISYSVPEHPLDFNKIEAISKSIVESANRQGE